MESTRARRRDRWSPPPRPVPEQMEPEGTSSRRASRFRLPAAFALVLAATACDAEVPSEAIGVVQAPFTTGYGPARGHEDVLRFGVEFANTLLYGETGVPGPFPSVEPGDDCLMSENPLVLGNGATDFPDDPMTDFYDTDSHTWHTSPTLQNLHFLRNYVGDDVETAREACVGSERRILAATRRAGKSWRSGSSEDTFYWIGHATHILQDSFASPHTQRSGTGLRTLIDLCSYGREVPGVCYHSSVALGDRIWITSLACELNPHDRSWDCLTPEAQAAAYATAGYLRIVGRWLAAGAIDEVEPALTTWFTGDAVDDYTGYLSCDALEGLSSGAACGDDRVCDTGACVDGVCCARECGACEVCDAPGREGLCTDADEGTDPHDDCSPPGGDPWCAGSCDGAGACAYPGAESSCGLCSACDGRGECASVPADDDACGVIDCSDLDTACRTYADRTADRCAALGRCLPPDTPSTCTDWTDLGCDADADATDPETDGAIDDVPDASWDADPWPPAEGDGGCSCAVAPPRASSTLSLLAVLGLALVVGGRRARRHGAPPPAARGRKAGAKRIFAESRDGIGTITLDHPAKRNVLSAPLIAEAIEALDAFRRHGIRVVLLRARPGAKVWSAGHDVRELPPRRDPCAWAIRLSSSSGGGEPPPVLAVIEGTVGGGCGWRSPRHDPRRPTSPSP